MDKNAVKAAIREELGRKKEPWVPRRATPRDPNKPRAVPGAPGTVTDPPAPSSAGAAAPSASPAKPNEPWVPRRATPRDPNKPRADPRNPISAPTPAAPGQEQAALYLQEQGNG